MGRGAGSARTITTYGMSVLHRRCTTVTSFDAGLAKLVDDMFASMYAARGVGLAANQIGVNQRVFVLDCPDEDGGGDRVVGHVVNPVLQLPPPPRELNKGSEGCLSVPGQYADVTRSATAVVTGFDVHGDPVRIEGAGLVARCLQHEYDHLQGTLYVDRLTSAARRSLLASAGLPAKS